MFESIILVLVVIALAIVTVQQVRDMRAFRRDLDEIHARLAAHHKPKHDEDAT